MTAKQFDYIIVGAGSAGCVLAERLTANGRHTVALIEAGGSDRRFMIKMPLGYAFTFSDPRVNWCFTAQPDPGLAGRAAYWPRGQVLGGSSSINAMAYLRGLPQDYDDWEQAGAAGWGWNRVESAFDQIETRITVQPDGRQTTEGTGPVIVSDLHDRMHPFSQNFIAAARETGWPVADDLNAVQDARFGYLRSTVRGARRWSAADAFLRPAMKRPNLTVIRHAQAEQIILDGRRAIGLRYRIGDTSRTIHARAEVILSAGAIGSPHLLQLSGVGPAAHLRAHGIAVRHDLPQVGQGLQDHLAVSQYYRATVPTLNQWLGSRFGQALAGARYLLTGRGPLSVPVNNCSGFVRSTPDAPRPDVQVYCNPASYDYSGKGGTPRIDPDWGYLLCVQPARPTSRGRVTLAGPDPRSAPLIQPNSLATEHDRQTAIAASKLIATMARTQALSGVTQGPIGPDMAQMDDAALLDNFRATAGSVYHASCTCRMGADAQTSVTDARLRVHGLTGLRVIDASAFPNVTSGNTNAPTLMLAWRAAEMVLQDAQNSL